MVIPEWIEGEPIEPKPSIGLRVWHNILPHILVLLAAIVGTFAWPLYLLGRLWFKRPPITPRFYRFVRCAHRILTEQPPPPGLSLHIRYMLMLELLRSFFLVPLWGLSWFLDELIYGRALQKIKIEKPLFEISAARSGSTQIARYLEDDPYVAAPSLPQFMFPFVWMWKLARLTIGCLYTPEELQKRALEKFPPAFLQRHELDLFRTDTFETGLLSRNLGHLSMMLSPSLLQEEFTFARSLDHNREIWEVDMVDFVEGIGKKTLYFAGPDPDGGTPKLFIKGHFLASADALSSRFPDARFLTVVRAPAPRIQSGINFIRVGPLMTHLRPLPWSWLASALLATEIRYCDRELEWYNTQNKIRKCVIFFDDYVEDLEGTMSQIYRECFDLESLPVWVPREHAPRQRTDYLINRSLEQLGIDVVALNERLADYIRWCREARKSAP